MKGNIMMLQQQRSSFLFIENFPYIEELYEAYLVDPGAVAVEWRDYFLALQTAPAADGSGRTDVAHHAVVEQLAAKAKFGYAAGQSGMALAHKQVAVDSLIGAFRMVGSRQAYLDPLRWSPSPPMAELTPQFYGLDGADMETSFSAATTYFSTAAALPLKELLANLLETYCGTIGAEFMHLADVSHREWWQARLESSASRQALLPKQRRHILERLSAAEGLEKYLHTRYVGQKRFSLEGGESLIVLLDELIRYGAANGVKRVVLGMAHRGRLNVLVNTIGKHPGSLFDEFDGKNAMVLPAGDVKYHKGYAGVAATEDGPVDITLAFNPSHLEIVNPVVEGMARGYAERDGQLGSGAVLPVEIHGDVAMSGQGVVMETMSLSQTKGHGTGGTIHIVVNNQVGFTTSDPGETRSSFYSTDIAKMIEAPILHVNGDDPEAVVAAVRLAIDYRASFQRSVMIDLVCFRRYGHQEQDTPGITQPLMYRAVANHPGVRSLYAQKLVDDGVLTPEKVGDYAASYREFLTSDEVPAERPASAPRVALARHAAPDLAAIHGMAHQLSVVPPNISLHPLVAKVLSSRADMADGKKALDWGMAEHLAFGTLLAQGVNVRLSGQDSERGTFSHRHAVLNDQHRTVRGAGKYTPLDHVGPDQASFAVNNSILSEAAVLAFEYGYASVRDDALVLWEAQFGDFANGAQVVIDNFIASGAAKWGLHNGVTLLLPHGQEGQGPEHASARLERYLQLCAQDNIAVCQPTTPAQFFHLLRRQALATQRKPLVVMTPKSLLRHAEAVSSLEELAEGHFREVLSDIISINDAMVGTLIVCSGKVYFDLLDHYRTSGAEGVAIARLEQLYPFPAQALSAQVARFPHLTEIVWAQEEPRNQGAWKMIEEDLRALAPPKVVVRDASREASPATAPGNMALHLEQQARVIGIAFANVGLSISRERITQ
jgi:2-oxoglutarate dehydrogenase E1 component